MKILASVLAATVVTIVALLALYTARHACEPLVDSPCYAAQVR